jgi:hypothetical protein
MKRLIISVAVVLALLLALAAPVFATTRQTWQLDSENPANQYSPIVLPGPLQMEKVGSPGDNGQLGMVTLPVSASVIWIADQQAQTKVTFTNGNWVVDLITDSNWGNPLGPVPALGLPVNCTTEVGQWDGSSFVALSTPVQIAYSYNYIHPGNSPQTLVAIIKFMIQTGPVSVDAGKYLAFRVINIDTMNHTIYTGEGDYASCISSPETDPGYPLPELAAGALLGVGLIGVGGFVFLRRKNSSAKI